jgi:hypothetical protein
MIDLRRLTVALALMSACEDKGDTDTSDTGTDTRSDATDSADGSDTRDTAPAGVAPTLTRVDANVQGARGLNLRLTLIGSDNDKDIDRVRLRLFDAAGQPLDAFRSGLSDTPDTNETVLSFDVAADVTNKKDILATATLRDIFPAFEPGKVEVALIDESGLESAFVEADIIEQEVLNQGDPCDETYTENRCEPGLGCREGQCREGLPPEITKLAYLNGQGGTRIVVTGTEPEDDIDSVLVEFLDNAGLPVLVDLDSDQVPESDRFEVNAQGSSDDGVFFVRLDPSAEFESQVKQIAVTATDLADHEGTRKTTKLVASPVRSAGQGCDPRGFDVCNANSACVQAATGTTWSCRDKNQLRKAECAAAPELALDGTPLVGFADGASIFDAPLGCSSGDPTGRSEGVVRLILESPAAKLTLSTNHPGTSFDTVLYLVRACGETADASLGCADESESSAAATLELELVPAGNYLVVVDSWSPTAGEFVLTATIE